MNTLLANTLIATAGIIRGTLASAFNYLNTLIKSGGQGAMKFHEEGIAFAREMGMNAKEAQAYTEVLTDRTERLAMKYGVAAEQVKELQRNISIATSRQLMLNESQAEGFLQLNKLVGSSTVTKFTEEMMNGMGGQLDSVQGAVSKAYASAAKSGLNAQKVSEKIANNLNLANKLSFRTGIEGLTRMAMQAEKVGMNLSSIDNVASKFLEIDDAIEASARLNMLGGSAAMLGGNPLDMAYEANADPEALMKRVVKMAQGAAKFDAQKGIATVDPMMQDYLRNVAKAIGMNPDELVGSAKKQASNAYKESNINFGAFGNLTKEQRDFLINKSDVAKGGNVKFTTTDNKVVDLSNPSNVNQEDFKKVLDEMMKYEGMSDHDIMAENARSLSSINEILTGIKESITAMFAKFIEGLFPDIQKDVKDLGGWFKGKLEPIAKDVGEGARSAYNWIKENKNLIKDSASLIIDFIKGFSSLIAPILNFAKDWPKTSAAIIAAIWGYRKLNKLGVKNSGASAAAKGSNNGMSWKQAKNAAKASKRATKGSKWKAASNATKNLTKNVKWLSKGVKGAAGIGTALSVFEIGSSIYDAHSKRKEIEENKALSKIQKQQEKDKVTKEEGKNIGEATGALAGGIGGAKAGAVIGSMIAPGIGTIIGGLLGGVAGGIGGAWIGNKTGEGAASLFTSKSEKHAEGGVIGGNSYSGDKVPILANSGEAVINKQQFDRAFGGSEKYAQGGIIGTTSRGSEGVITPQQFNAVFGETPVKPKNSLGEAEYIYKPNRTEISRVNGNTITVKDFNINISGTLKLDAGSYSKSIDGRELLNDYTFMTEIKNMIKQSINQDINGGRFKNDLATVGGFPAQTSIYGIR